MFRDQKLQVASCLSKKKEFLIYKKGSSSIFVQVQQKFLFKKNAKS